MKIELRLTSTQRRGEGLKILIEKYPLLKDLEIKVEGFSYPIKNTCNYNFSIVYFEANSIETSLFQLQKIIDCAILISKSKEIIPNFFQVSDFDYSPITDFTFEICNS